MFEPLETVFSKLERPVLFEDGVGAVLDSNKNNQHVFPILRGDESSFSHNPKAADRHETSLISGEHLTLVSGY